MQLDLDVRESVQRTAGSPAPSHPWILGLVADEKDTTAKRTSPARGYSYAAECECPDDCPRDHGNE